MLDLDDYFDELNSDNFLIYATKKYNSTAAFGLSELNDDLERFMSIKRMMRKYKRDKEINVRLLVNHFVILNNLFGPLALNRMLFYYIDDCNAPQVMTVLDFLNILYPDHYKLPEVPCQDSPPLENDEELISILKDL